MSEAKPAHKYVPSIDRLFQSVARAAAYSIWRRTMAWQTLRMVCLRCSMFFMSWMAEV